MVGLMYFLRKKLVEINRYYRRNDLKVAKFKDILTSISDFEVFESFHEDAILADTINGLCKVMSYKEYEENDEFRGKNGNFFSRAFFDPKKQTLNPPYEQWERTCICRKAANPDIPVIQCDLCSEWLHLECMGLSFEAANIAESFKCPNCQSKSQASGSLKESEATSSGPKPDGLQNKPSDSLEGDEKTTGKGTKETVVILRLPDIESEILGKRKEEEKGRRQKDFRDKKAKERGRNPESSAETESKSLSDFSQS
jgi:PHD-finger